MRERTALTQALEKQKALIARRARLKAERDGAKTIAMPSELIKLEPIRAEEILNREQLVLKNLIEVHNREKSGHERIVALTQSEVAGYETDVAMINQRIKDLTARADQLKSLHDQRVINQQRVSESMTALDAAQRDKELATTGLLHAKATLERESRDLSLLALANDVRIAKEFGENEQEIAQIERQIQDTRRMMTGLESISGMGESSRSMTYRIARKSADGNLAFMQASETTPIMPGDLIQVERGETDPLIRVPKLVGE